MYTLFHRIRDHIRSRFPRRLTIHTLHSGPDWDKGGTLLHASFQLLVNYIEQECPEFPIAYDLNPDLKVARDEMDLLYHWWTVERPARLTLSDRFEGIPAPEWEDEWVDITEGKYAGSSEYVPQQDKYPEYYAILRAEFAIEIAYGEEDQQRLHRLVDVREYMWT